VVSDKAIRQGFYQKLNTASLTSLLAEGSASLNHYIAKLDAPFPFVIFHKQSGRPVNRFGGNAFDDHLWLVKGLSTGTVTRDGTPTSSAAEDIAKAIDDLLDFGTITVSGGTVLALTRESDVDYTETVNDQMYAHRGALYRLRVAA
jgi:hypothetical protein